MLLLLIPLLLVAGSYVAYLLSSAAAARKRARKTVLTLQALEREVEAQQRLLQDAVLRTAADYAGDVRIGRLRAFPVDELRRHTSGLRLQALKDAGLRNLADLQNWNSSRLAGLRGVGPKSAITVAAVVDLLTKQSNALSIPYPLPSSASQQGTPFLQAICLRRWSQWWLGGNHERLRAVSGDFRRRRDAVVSKIGYLRWALRFGRHPDIQAAVAESYAMSREMQGDYPAARIQAELSGVLANIRSLQANGIAWPLISEDYTKAQDYYLQIFQEQLGSASGANIQSAPNAGVQNVIRGAVEPVSVRMIVTAPIPSVSVPQPPASLAPFPRAHSLADVWVVPGRDVNVARFVIKGGMVYVGSGLRSVRGDRREPALIDPSLPVAYSAADCHTRKTDYWPSYDTITPEARASYLQWLSNGKSDPGADIGYVFLYLYGLERRALADSLHDPQALAELPIVEQEVRRLFGIYENNHSFRLYAGSLLDYLTARKVQNATPETLPIPQKTNSWDLSFEMRAGLGFHARAGRPLPAEWALAWYLSAPQIRRGIAVTRCPEQFAALFAMEFEKRFGAGFKLPVNKTRIKVTHRPASLSFGGESLTAELDLPDVSVLSGPVGKLQEVGDTCSELLTSYSRYIGANPDKNASREALLLLPPSVWPGGVNKPLRELRDSIREASQARVMPMRELVSLLPAGEEFNKVRFAALARALANIGLGIEPDVRTGGTVPGIDDPIVLFAADDLDQDRQPSEKFTSAAFMLHLSSLVASADGSFEDSEAAVISAFLNSVGTMAEAERQRLLARLCLYRASPPSSAGIKKRIANMDQAGREAISAFLLQVALADGVVDPGEVKVLEKLFGLLGLEQQSLYRRLHESETQFAPAAPAPAPAPVSARDGAKYPATVRFDVSKIAALKADSAKVSALLEKVFSDQAASEPQEPAAREPEPLAPTLLDLDPEHAGLLQVLLQRTQWSREELEELCSDRGLMVDGAVERINEAAFSKFDQPLIEGDDPVDINSQLIAEEKAV